jgi:hypothetical protein
VVCGIGRNNDLPCGFVLVRTPVGYASAAKETSEETGLPEPGSKMMEEFRDYHKILKSVKGFVEFVSCLVMQIAYFMDSELGLRKRIFGLFYCSGRRKATAGDRWFSQWNKKPNMQEDVCSGWLIGLMVSAHMV